MRLALLGAALAAGVAGAVAGGSALDCGAAGVMVPHVSSAEIAREVAAACRYRSGRRGFTNSSRAGRYGGLGLAAHLEAGDAGTTVIKVMLHISKAEQSHRLSEKRFNNPVPGRSASEVLLALRTLSGARTPSNCAGCDSGVMSAISASRGAPRMPLPTRSATGSKCCSMVACGPATTCSRRWRMARAAV